MSWVSRSVGFVAAVWLAATLTSAAPLRAGTIQITGGALDMNGMSGLLSIAGDGGFTLTAGVGAASGIYAPADCFLPSCGPGSVIDLRASWSDNDLPGTATLGGVTYSRLGALDGIASATVGFTGQAIAPPLGTTGSAVITAPFAFAGFFIQPVSAFEGVRHDLAGRGVATLWLEKNFDGTTWRPERVSYDFDAVPTPEPATMLLLGSGLAATALLRRRRAAR